jgi:opacity protein-like surface antigen
MINTIKIALLSTVIGTSLYASNYDSETNAFIGLELGYATVDGQVVGNSNIFEQSENVEYGVHIGAQNSEWRAILALNYYNDSETKQNVEKFIGMVDYFFLANPYDAIRPYIGMNIGAVNYESTGVEATDMIYGGQAGVVLNVGDNIEADLSYRYSISSATELNDMSSMVFGLNYIY